ncbi:unnamed protein product [Ectocarpus sp. 6 AP-2014]
MPGKLAKRSIIEEHLMQSLRSSTGSGTGFVSAIRVSTDFKDYKEKRADDLVRANNVRLLLNVRNGKTTFRTSRLECCGKPLCTFSGNHDNRSRTYFTCRGWTDHELQQAHQLGCLVSLLEADPLDANVYYIVHADDVWQHYVDEIDFAVKRLARELLLTLGEGRLRDKFLAKQPAVVRLNEEFHDQMFRVLLPSFQRMVSSDKQEKSPADVLDSVGVKQVDETVDIYIAYRDC